MEQKVEQFILKGMQRDTSISKASNEFSFENMNIRITARDNNTLLSVTNEKGNKEVLNTLELLPNLIKVELTDTDTWKVIAKYPVKSEITGTLDFEDIDGNYDETMEWTIPCNSTTSEEYKVGNDSYSNLTINTDREQYKYDMQFIYVTSLKNLEQPKKEVTIIGETLGYAVLNKYLVLFTKWIDPTNNLNTVDYIFRIEFSDKFVLTTLYYGNLGFNINNPIETLPIYENEDIQKVYWVDGLNQPRMINVAASENVRSNWKDFSFDAVPTLKLQEEVKIERNQIANGVFAPGVIQYIFTYYNKYGQESNPFYTSPLYYTSFNDRGGSPEDKVSNSFNITIKNADSNFDYVRIYSLLRTSLDGTPLSLKDV